MEVRESRRDDVLAVALLSAVIAVLFADVLFAGNVLLGRDLITYHYGMKKVLRELLLSGEFPYWNRFFSAGQPMAANPAWEVFYPFQLPILVPGFLFGFNLHIVLHVLIAASGMYALLRRLAVKAEAAFAGAISFALGGMVMSATGLLPFLFSISWMPWVIVFGVGWFNSRRVRDLVLAALAMSMQVLIGEPLTFAQTAFLLGFGALWFGTERGGLRDGFRCAIAAVAVVVFALAIGAVQLIPALDFARDSVRSLPLGFAAASRWSMPILRPFEMVFPHWAGSVAGDGSEYFGGRQLYGPAGVPFIYSIYLGLLIAACAIAGIVRRIRGWAPAMVVVAGAYLLAIGEHTPLLRLLYDAHVFASVRYPEKFFISAVFAIAIFGSLVLQRLIDGDVVLRRTAAVLAAIAAAIAAIVFAGSLLPGSDDMFRRTWHLAPSRLSADFFTASRMQWAATAAKALALSAILFFAGRFRGRAFAGALILFVFVDVVPRGQETIAGRARDFLQPPPLLQQLPRNGERVFNQAAVERMSTNRVGMTRAEQYWIARNGLYPYLSGYFGVPTVMEYDIDGTGLLNMGLFDEVARAAMVRRDPSWPDAYMRMMNASVRLLPLDERAELARAPSLDVAPVVRAEAKELPRYEFAAGLSHVESPLDVLAIGRSGIIAPGVAFTALPSRRVEGGIIQRVVEHANDATLDVTAHGQAFLIASVTNHRYWSATIDGVAATIVPANIAFQGLVVPPGRHTIVFRYHNPLITVGAVVSLVSLLALVSWALYADRRQRPEQQE